MAVSLDRNGERGPSASAARRSRCERRRLDIGSNARIPRWQDRETFTSPEQAATAMVDAAEKFDVPSLLRLVGSDGGRRGS